MIRATLFGLGAVLLIGCSSNAKKPEVHGQTGVLEPLVAPPGLSLPERDPRFSIPGIDDLSDRARSAVQSQPRLTRRTLAQKDVIMHDEDGISWLEINAPPEEIWNLLVTYWAEKNVPLIVSDPRTGVITTDWMSALDKKGRRNPETRDQYRMRLERDNNFSKVFISHISMRRGERLANGQYQWDTIDVAPRQKQLILLDLMKFLTHDARAQR